MEGKNAKDLTDYEIAHFLGWVKLSLCDSLLVPVVNKKKKLAALHRSKSGHVT